VSGEQSGEAVGNAALDQLREARRQLEQNKSGRLQRDTQDALERAQELRRQQQQMTERVERFDPADPNSRADLSAIQQAKERMGSEVGSLEADLEQLSREAMRDQPEAARRLAEAAGEIRDNQIREKILYSRGVVQQRSKEYARNFEEHIEGTFARLEERLEAAASAIGETSEQRMEQALEETREVVTALESLEDRLRASAEAQEGEGQGQQQGQGEGQAAGGDSTGANPNASPQNGSGQIRPQDLRQFNRELTQRREQLEELREQLEQEGIDATDLERIIDRLRGLGSGSGLSGPESIAVLERDIVQGLKEFEYSLRRSLAPSDDGQLLQVDDDEVPDGYEEMVEEYYKALAGERNDQ
jgi:DNA repair exonuclease SbcCD ATPase subunit